MALCQALCDIARRKVHLETTLEVVSLWPSLSRPLQHGRIARDSHGLPIVLLGPPSPKPSMPYRRSHYMALWLFKGWPPTGWMAFGRLLTLLAFPCHMPSPQLTKPFITKYQYSEVITESYS
jgi:hypothetical protein